jgi:repressor of nif and glnA expression
MRHKISLIGNQLTDKILEEMKKEQTPNTPGKIGKIVRDSLDAVYKTGFQDGLAKGQFNKDTEDEI